MIIIQQMWAALELNNNSQQYSAQQTCPGYTHQYVPKTARPSSAHPEITRLSPLGIKTTMQGDNAPKEPRKKGPA